MRIDEHMDVTLSSARGGGTLLYLGGCEWYEIPAHSIPAPIYEWAVRKATDNLMWRYGRGEEIY